MAPTAPAAGRPSSTSTSRLERIELLYEVTRQFASTLELDVVLGQVLSLTVQSVEASAGSIFLLDPAGRVVRSMVARGNQPPELHYPTVEAVMNKGFAGWVCQQRRAGIVNDTESDPRWHVFPDDELPARSAVAAPLIHHSQMIGVITLTHPEPGWFSSEQLELLEAIAIQAASAVERAALYTRVNSDRSMLLAVISGVQDAILVTDAQERLILANPAAQRNLLLTESEHGRPLDELLPEQSILELYRTAGESGAARREETLADGRVFDCVVVSVPNVGKILAMHDVTTFKQLDAMKNDFVSQVAHDLKAPLGIIFGYTTLLADLPSLDEEENVIYVRPILMAINRMRALIENILDIGRIEMGIEAEFELVDLATIVHSVVSHFQKVADEKGVVLTVKAAGNLPPVKGAPLRLEQAVSNLVGNAIKFTPGGGLVRVETGRQDGQVVVSVTDTGPGIRPALQDKLFHKFARLGQTGTQKQEGHGLGLAIVKSIVDAHRGQVWVESELGKGSTFALALPAS